MYVLCATWAAGSINAHDGQNLRVNKVQSLRQWETEEFLTYSGLESIRCPEESNREFAGRESEGGG